MMRSFMYLRPGNLTKDFIIEQHSTSLSEIGRPKTAYQDDGNCMLKGVLAEADTRQKMRWEQLQHPITHTIVQTGKPKAKAEDLSLIHILAVLFTKSFFGNSEERRE